MTFRKSRNYRTESKKVVTLDSKGEESLIGETGFLGDKPILCDTVLMNTLDHELVKTVTTS